MNTDNSQIFTIVNANTVHSQIFSYFNPHNRVDHGSMGHGSDGSRKSMGHMGHGSRLRDP